MDLDLSDNEIKSIPRDLSLLDIEDVNHDVANWLELSSDERAYLV